MVIFSLSFQPDPKPGSKVIRSFGMPALFAILRDARKPARTARTGSLASGRSPWLCIAITNACFSVRRIVCLNQSSSTFCGLPHEVGGFFYILRFCRVYGNNTTETVKEGAFGDSDDDERVLSRLRNVPFAR